MNDTPQFPLVSATPAFAIDREKLTARLSGLIGKLPPRPWSVYNKPLRPRFSKTKIIEIQDRTGRAVIPWSGFDDIAIPNRLAIARFIVAIVNGFRCLVAQQWLPIKSAPKDGNCFLAVVDGTVRQVTWGKTSHVPLYGWIYADQGEETDLCEPTYWMPMPIPPSGVSQ